jgi:site-specific DNA-methyltransferase (adenine-specific)
MIINKQLANSNGVSEKDLWETDPELYKVLNNVYRFTLDPCCVKETAKCNKFYTPIENGLIQDWTNEVVFMNPPYSRGNIDKWIEKAYNESLKRAVIVALIPVSASAKWWHKYVIGKCDLVYIQGRVKFVGAESTAPFSSVLAIYGDKNNDFFNMEKKRGGFFVLNCY